MTTENTTFNLITVCYHVSGPHSFYATVPVLTEFSPVDFVYYINELGFITIKGDNVLPSTVGVINSVEVAEDFIDIWHGVYIGELYGDDEPEGDEAEDEDDADCPEDYDFSNRKK